MPRTLSPELTLRDAFGFLLYHKWKLALSLFLGVGAAAAYTVWTPQTFRSESKLFLRLGRENMAVDPTATLGQPSTAAVPQSREAELNSVVEMLLNRTLVERLVDTVGPDAILKGSPDKDLSTSGALVAGFTPTPTVEQPWYQKLNPLPKLEDRERAILSLFNMFSAETVKKTNVILVRCDADSPERAQSILARLVELYIDEHVRSNRTPKAQAFLAEQASRLRDDVTRTEETLRKLKDETGLTSPDDQRRLLVERLGKLQGELGETTTAAQSLRAEVGEIERILSTLSQTQVTGETKGFSNEALDNMRGQLFSLQLQEKSLLAKYQPDHIDVVHVRQQIAAAQTELQREQKARSQVTTGVNPIYALAETNLLQKRPTLASLVAKESSVRTLVADAQRALGVLDGQALQIARLQRELDIHDVNYRRYAGNLEQAQLDERLQKERISNISVVQPATLEPKSIRPKPATNLALGALFGLFGGMGWALASQALRSPPSPSRDTTAAATSDAVSVSPVPRPRTRPAPVTAN